jgi:hypothetical protein
MAAARAVSLVNSWETVRFELLQTRICDLGLQIEGTALERHIERLYRELAAKQLYFRPKVYLSDEWGCPDEVPIIGIPFYLTEKRLARLEEEQTGSVEDESSILQLLRHEAGHAINYAFRLWEHDGWTQTFGRFEKPYRDTYRANSFSRNFVRHLWHQQYGRTYAQKHPDEDFAETFAVWLTPRSAWRRRYRNWPALAKLEFVDDLMHRLRRVPPQRRNGCPVQPIEELTITLAEHYGERAERYRKDAQGYVDDKLCEVFPETNGRPQLASAAVLLRKHESAILKRVKQWSGLEKREVEAILDKLADRAEALDLSYRPSKTKEKLMDMISMATSLAIDFAYTGRLTG